MIVVSAVLKTIVSAGMVEVKITSSGLKNKSAGPDYFVGIEAIYCLNRTNYKYYKLQSRHPIFPGSQDILITVNLINIYCHISYGRCYNGK
jgi:hypothetical protein